MAKYKPAHLKQMNTRIVFQEFWNNQSLFVNEIARKTKISVPTVMKIVDFLVEKELVTEQECTVAKVGRKPNMLTLKKKYFSIGVLYEGDYLFLGIVDMAGNMTNFSQVKCGSHFEKSLFISIDRLLEMGQKSTGDLVGIGIGMPCIFNKKTRNITAELIGIDTPQYFGDTIDRISEKYQAKVVVDNDLNMQAYGEYISVKAASSRDLIFVSLGTGLGAGIIIDGKVRTGNNNICGEIGYMVLDYPADGEEVEWVENKINSNALEKRYSLSMQSPNEAKITEAVDFVSKYLALIVNNLIFSYDITDIVLDGHVLDLLGDSVLEATQSKLERICYKPVTIGKKHTPAPGILGAARLACNTWLEELFS